MKARAVLLATALAFACAGNAQAEAPFGTKADIQYAEALWKEMSKHNFVGQNALMSTPYKGQHPHGAVLDTFDTVMSVRGDKGELIVKRNYGGEGVSESAVANDPEAFLKSVTVMFRRDGYDPENGNWFWAKYKPDGELDTNPKGMELAGRVAKGADKGCIACHQAAPGGDYVFNHDRMK